MKSIFKIYGTNVGNITAREGMRGVVGRDDGDAFRVKALQRANERFCAVLCGEEAKLNYKPKRRL